MPVRILPDSAIWIDHLRFGDERLVVLNQQMRLLAHPFVAGEVLLGSLKNREKIGRDFRLLQQATVARHEEVLLLLENKKLFGKGIGFVDLHLVAAVLITPNARLWTRDKRLLAVAEELGVAYAPDH